MKEELIINIDSEGVTTDLKGLILASLENGKAENISTVTLKGKSDIADYMIVASGTSNRHTCFLAEKLVQQIKNIDFTYTPSIEGQVDGNWVLIDAGDVIVHIFKTGVREIYNLENMWSVPITEAELTTA